MSPLIVDNQQSFIVQYYRDYTPALVFLADRTNLRAIYEAKTLVIDGTFNFRPNGFAQTYTIHAVFSEMPNRQSSFLSGKFKFNLKFFIRNRVSARQNN